MTVPNRPTAGSVLEAGWGQVAHDTAVAVDIQRGVSNVPANAGTLAVTFARPFASPPVVVVTQASSSRNYGVAITAPTTTGFSIIASQFAGSTPAFPAVPTVALDFDWLAIGPRA